MSVDPLPLSGHSTAKVADALVRRSIAGSEIRARGLLGVLAARNVTGSVAEPALETLMRAGLLRLRHRARGRRVLDAVLVLRPAALEELARPGERGARERELSAAKATLAGLDHPVAQEAYRALEDEGATLAPSVVRALAAVAKHAAAGEVLAERVFAARHLGSSKALGPVRNAVERRLGPLAGLGIREGGALVLIGGPCRLAVANGSRAELDVGAFHPYLGVARDTALAIERLDLPTAGLVAVENLTAFEACCRGEVSQLSGAAFVWTAGYPGRGVRAVIEAAARAGAPVRVWADLDLDGLRIARLVARWAPSCVSHRMGPGDLEVLAGQPLAVRARTAIERELAGDPHLLHAETLRAMLAANRWVEQEEMLGR